MKIIGITGGVGTGKSTVMNYIKDHYEVAVILADDVAKELMEPHKKAYNKIVANYGTSFIQDDGQIDRALLAKMLFSNDDMRQGINAIVHPLVKEEIKARLQAFAEEGYKYAAVEAALLIEDDYESICDEFWYVWAPEDVRTQRLMANRHYSLEKVKQMLQKQLSDEEYEQHCKRRIDNGKDLLHLQNQLDKFF